MDFRDGFDLEMVDFDQPTIIDDCMKRNPQQLLSYFIVYRKELKIEVGNLNAKVSNVDKKICEILDLISSNKTKSENFVTNIELMIAFRKSYSIINKKLI